MKELQEPYSKEVIRKCRTGQKKLMWVVSYKTEMADESSVVELLGVMEFVNAKMDNFKKAAGILKRGGSSSEIKELLTGKKEKKRAPVDLLDMGDDFLEIEENNPLDALEKFVYGRERVSAQVVRKIEVEEVKEVRREKERVEVKEEKKVEHRRLEQPDLLFDEPEPPVSNQGTMLDLAGLNFGTAPAPGAGYGQPVPSNNFGQFAGGAGMGHPGQGPQVMGNMGYVGNMGPMGNMPNMMGMPGPMGTQPAYPNPSMPGNYPYQNYPQSGQLFSNYGQVPSVQGGHLVPARLSNQPSNDDFEDFFSEIANRKVQ